MWRPECEAFMDTMSCRECAEKEDCANSDEFDVTVNMSKNQMYVMRDALEFYSRFLAGQLDAFPPAFEELLWAKKKTKWEEPIQKPIADLKRYIFDLDSNSSYSINSKELSKEAKIAYEMYHQIYNLDAHESSVYKYALNKYFKICDEPLIKITKGNNEDRGF